MGNGYDGSIRIKYDIDTKDANSKMLKAVNDIKKTEAEITRLKKRMAELAKEKIPTYEYKEMQNELAKAEKHADALYGKLRLMEKSGDTASKGYQNLKNQIRLANQQVDSLRAGIVSLETSKKAFVMGDTSEEYRKSAQKVQKLNDKLKVSKKRLAEMYNSQTNVRTGFDKMQAAAKKFFSVLSKDTKKSSGVLKTFASRFKGIMLSLLVFNWISKGFNAMVSVMREGFKNLAQYSTEYNSAISDLKSQSAQLKNGLAAAFEPIVNMAIPYLTRLVEILNTAAESLSRFFAILGGKSTYTRAKKQLVDYAKTLSDTQKKAAGALASFDDINVLNKNDEGTSSAGGEMSGAAAFETVDVGQVSGFIESLKTAIDEGDWQGIAAILAQKANEWLEGIDWTQLAEDLSEKLKTWFSTSRTFLEEFDWETLGEDIGTFLKNVDWLGILEEVGLLIWAAVCGVWDLLCGLFEGLGVMDWLEENLNWSVLLDSLKLTFGGIIEFLTGLFTGDFDEAMGGIKKILKGVCTFAKTAVENANKLAISIIRKMWTDIKEKFSTSIALIKNIVRVGFQFMHTIVSNIIDKIKGVISKGLEIVRTTISNIINNIKKTWDKVWNMLPKPIQDMLSKVWGTIKSNFNKILGGLEWLINKVISGINFLLSKLNLINFDIPDWVPVIGGGKFGFSFSEIKEVSIPRLANGAVIRGGNPYLAWLGDQPAGQTNIETPLPTMLEAFKQALSESGIDQKEPIIIKFNGNMAELARVLKPALDAESGRIGRSLLVQ